MRELYEWFPGKIKFIKLSSSSNSDQNSQDNDTIPSHFQLVHLKLPKSTTFVEGVGRTIKQAKIAAAKYIVRKLRYPDFKK